MIDNFNETSLREYILVIIDDIAGSLLKLYSLHLAKLAGTISVLPPRFDDNKPEILLGKFVCDTFLLILNYISNVENLYKVESHKCFEILSKLTRLMCLQRNVARSIAHVILEKIGDTMCNFRIRCCNREHGMFFSIRVLYFNLLAIVNDLLLAAEDYLASETARNNDFVLLEVQLSLYDYTFKKALPKVYNSLLAHARPFLDQDDDFAILIQCENLLTPIVDTLRLNQKMSVGIILEKARHAIPTLAIVKSFTFIEMIFDIL